MAEPESLNGLLRWYAEVYIPQMVSGSNIRPERMAQNLAVLRDAISAYRASLGRPYLEFGL